MCQWTCFFQQHAFPFSTISNIRTMGPVYKQLQTDLRNCVVIRAKYKREVSEAGGVRFCRKATRRAAYAPRILGMPARRARQLLAFLAACWAFGAAVTVAYYRCPPEHECATVAHAAQLHDRVAKASKVAAERERKALLEQHVLLKQQLALALQGAGPPPSSPPVAAATAAVRTPEPRWETPAIVAAAMPAEQRAKDLLITPKTTDKKRHGLRPVCYPWDDVEACEQKDASLEDCNREEVLSRFADKYGVIWRPQLGTDGVLAMDDDGSVTVHVMNHGSCKTNCATHLWAVLTGRSLSAPGLLIAAHDVAQLNDSAIALTFAVPHAGAYLLTVEQRFWHGDVVSSEAHDFNFAARNLDLASHWALFQRYEGGTKVLRDPFKKDRQRLLRWEELRDKWQGTGCLQLDGSPFQVKIQQDTPRPGQAAKHKTQQPPQPLAVADQPLVPLRACTIADWASPGYWVSPLPGAQKRLFECHFVPINPEPFAKTGSGQT